MAKDQAKDQSADTDAEVNKQSDDQDGGKTSAPHSFKVGDKEYTVDQLKDYVEKGNKYDEFMPEFTKKSQRLKELEAEQKELEEKKNLTPDEEQRQEQIKQFFNDPITRGELKKMMIEERRTINVARDLQKELDNLSMKYDGEDGRPKFEEQKTRDYVAKNGLWAYKPEDVYKRMYEKELLEWERDRILNKKKKPTYFQRGSTGATLPADRKKIKTFEDAQKAAYERLENAE